VEVIAVFHSHRDPSVWQARVKAGLRPDATVIDA
jgi:hypothetical protein